MGGDPSEPSASSAIDLASIPQVFHPRLSPDGSELAFLRRDEAGVELRFHDLETGRSRGITHEALPGDLPLAIRWDADESGVFVHHNEEAHRDHDIWLVGRDGNASPVVEREGFTVLLDVSDDGRWLYFFEGTAERTYHRLNCETGETTQVATDASPRLRISPNGGRIAFDTRGHRNPEGSEVMVADADGDDPRSLTLGSSDAVVGFVGWHPEGDRLLVFEESEYTRPGIYDLETDAVTWFDGVDANERPVAFLPDRTGFVAVRSYAVETDVVIYEQETNRDTSGGSFKTDSRRIPLEGVTDIPRTEYAVDGLVSPDGAVLVGHSTSVRPERIGLAAPESGAFEPILDPAADHLDSESLADARQVAFESEDGTILEALVSEPISPAEDGDTPGVVLVHGGPHDRATRSFDPLVQYLCSRGFAVCRPNYRGSSGRSRSFREAIEGDWGGVDRRDVATATVWFAEQPGIAGDRLAVAGQSYGGFAALMQLLEHGDHYAAGVSWNGPPDIAMRFSDGELTDRNPLERADEFDTSLLLLQGGGDPAHEAVELLQNALTENGASVEYAQFPDQGHFATAPERRADVFETIGTFLEERLLRR